MKELINAFGNHNISSVIVLIAGLSVIVQYSFKLYRAATNLYEKTEEYEKIVQMTHENSESINELRQSIEQDRESNNEYKIRMLADTLYVCYKHCKDTGYITRRQLENFQDNVKLYQKIGGNGVVEHKYIPEIMEMEVKE